MIGNEKKETKEILTEKLNETEAQIRFCKNDALMRYLLERKERLVRCINWLS